MALSTPSLWNWFEFNGKGASFERADAYLERSGATDLFICLDFRGECHSIDSEINKSFDLIVPEATRWACLEAIIPGEKTMNIVLERLCMCEGAPKLRFLELLAPGYNDADFTATERGDSPKRLFSGNAPRLCEIYLREVPLRWESDLAMFAGIESLTLDNHRFAYRPSYGHWIRLLSHAHNIRSLDVENSGPNAMIRRDSRERTIILPNLGELRLAQMEPTAAVEIMHSLHAPWLKRLVLEPGENFNYKEFLHRALLNPPHCFSPLLRLKELVLGELALTPDDVETLYCYSPVLEVLKIDLLSLETHFLTLINPSPKGNRGYYDHPLPELKELFVIGAGGHFAALTAMVEHRRKLHHARPLIISKIKKLVLCWQDVIRPMDAKRLKSCVKDVRILAGGNYEGGLRGRINQLW